MRRRRPRYLPYEGFASVSERREFVLRKLIEAGRPLAAVESYWLDFMEAESFDSDPLRSMTAVAGLLRSDLEALVAEGFVSREEILRGDRRPWLMFRALEGAGAL